MNSSSLLREKIEPAGVFLLGFLFFFVNNEPAPFDILAAVFIIAYARKIFGELKKPLLMAYLISQVWCLFLEYIKFSGFRWSLISIYLIFLMALFSCMAKRAVLVKLFLYGAFFGAVFSLLTLVVPVDVQTIIYDDRLRAFFKDPNVLSATALGLMFPTA